MSDQFDAADHATIGNLRDMALRGAAPSAMMRALQIRLGQDTHVVTVLNYFRHAFCLSLAETKPIAAFSRNASRAIDDEDQFDQLLTPAIEGHRSEWEKARL